MLNHRAGLLISIVFFALLAGCATPATRIKDNPDAYARLTSEQRVQVSKGEIALGMPDEAVMLALGKPDRVTERTDAKGVATVWHYVDQSTTVSTVDYVGFYDPFFFPFTPLVVSSPQNERDRVRVYFNGGKVSAIEREVKK